jgi:hypothetical protein
MATAIVIADAQATPVNHTFNPVGFLPATPDVFLFEDRSPGSFIGFNRITGSVIRPVSASKQANGDIRVKVQLILPKLETLGNASSGITPPDTLAYNTKVDVTYTLSERSSQLDRDNVVKMLPLLLADSQIKAMVQSFARIQ